MDASSLYKLLMSSPEQMQQDTRQDLGIMSGPEREQMLLQQARSMYPRSAEISNDMEVARGPASDQLQQRGSEVSSLIQTLLGRATKQGQQQ